MGGRAENSSPRGWPDSEFRRDAPSFSEAGTLRKFSEPNFSRHPGHFVFLLGGPELAAVAGPIFAAGLAALQHQSNGHVPAPTATGCGGFSAPQKVTRGV